MYRAFWKPNGFYSTGHTSKCVHSNSRKYKTNRKCSHIFFTHLFKKVYIQNISNSLKHCNNHFRRTIPYQQKTSVLGTFQRRTFTFTQPFLTENATIEYSVLFYSFSRSIIQTLYASTARTTKGTRKCNNAFVQHKLHGTYFVRHA